MNSPFDKLPVRSKADYEQEWQHHDDIYHNSVSFPIKDPASAGSSRKLDFRHTPTLHFGRIVLSMAYAHCYKVFLEHLNTAIWCADTTKTSLQPFGAKQLNTLQEGSFVIVVRHPTIRSYGFIIGVVPDFITNQAVGKSDRITQASRGGASVDELYSYIMQFKKNGGVVNFSAGRPTDSIPVGEWGAITETGLSVFLDPFMGYLRIDEANGFFVHYHDNLVRTAGENFQFRSLVEEYECLNDENELIKFGGRTPYFWEALGVMTYGTTSNKVFTSTESQIEKPHYALKEPVQDDQQPFYRMQQFDGYLGQGGKRQVVLPDPNELSSINTYAATPNRPAVFDESIGLTGRYSLTSAKGIHIGKRIILPAPKMIRRPEDLTGDTPANYKAAGMFGTGDAHVVTDNIPLPVTEGNLITAAAILDVHAHIHNWLNTHPFYYHENDWHLPEEGDTVFTANQTAFTFNNLATNQYLSAPTPVTVNVDHRYGNSKYWPTESYLDLLDEGGVVLGDGYGSEIRMVAGNIYLTCPGDVYFQPGRNLFGFAGKDCIIKAKKNIELSATQEDVRIKAERFMEILGGNSSSNGGVIVESRSPCDKYDFTDIGSNITTSGIILKSATSSIILDGQAVALNSRGNSGSGISPAIYLMAKGGRVKAFVDYYERIIKKGAFDIFSTSCNSVTAVNEYWADSALIGTPLRVKGKTVIDGCLMLNGWLTIVNGHVATDTAPTYGCKFATLTSPQITSQTTEITSLDDRASLIVTDAASITNDPISCDSAYKTWMAAAFSFRTTGQCGTNNFNIYESRWQQMARLSGQVMPTWLETFVTTNSIDTYPYPGSTATLANSYKTVDTNLFDPSVNRDKVRSDSGYTSPVFATPGTHPLSSYTVIV
jgi:hypothetical protein